MLCIKKTTAEQKKTEKNNKNSKSKVKDKVMKLKSAWILIFFFFALLYTFNTNRKYFQYFFYTLLRERYTRQVYENIYKIHSVVQLLMSTKYIDTATACERVSLKFEYYTERIVYIPELCLFVLIFNIIMSCSRYTYSTVQYICTLS